MNNKFDESELSEKCDHDVCHCVPRPDSAVADGKSVFCSIGCRNGVGCSHEDCNCEDA